MRILFMGTPDFAVPSLDAIVRAGHEVVGVVSQPDRPKGRGHRLMPTPVKEAALMHGISVYQPETLRNNSFYDELICLDPDIIIVVAYGNLLPSYVLDYPKYGSINVHASLLPKYRGAAPIQWSVINGDRVTGITTMYMDKKLDTGDIILKRETEIGDTETAGELFDRLAVLGGELIVETMERIVNNTAVRTKQDDADACYAPMLTKETGHIDWSKPASEIINLIRGTNPWPAAYSEYMGSIMKIFRAVPGRIAESGAAGEILGVRNKMLEVRCGGGSVLLDEIQFKGKKRMSIASYLNGNKIEVGEILR